ncbi:MAG: hypothetical protein HY923_06330 [Elusimicrobia bacterium]|nr:hypothetical protein [Elusimicrobiota bacterium]
MDVKDVLLGTENSLPTLDQNLSSGTVSVPSLPTITADAATYWKFGASTVIGTAGMLLLGYGKKNNDVRKMVIGAALTFASILFF